MAIHPGAEEADCSDPVDYNCDGSTGYSDADADGWAACVECDDGRSDANPGAAERCNGADDDCDGDIDEAGAEGETAWYLDADGDGWGDPTVSSFGCDGPAGYVSNAEDCDDGDAGLSPETRWYADADGDGWGGAEAPTVSCTAPPDAVRQDGDCDDADADTHPGAAEVCGGGDEDCDGLVDDADADVTGLIAFWTDADGDGWGDGEGAACVAPAGSASQGGDCDDSLASVNPGATEVCDAANRDEDCDGGADDADDSPSGGTSWYVDADGDGWGTSSTVTACDAGAGRATLAGDCDDTDPGVSPAAVEVCDSANVDEDCDGAADDADVGVSGASKLTWYPDADGDTHGSASGSLRRCDPPSGYVGIGDDCDDGDATISPSETERCDAADADEDCDGLADDADPSVGLGGKLTFYEDYDRDGFGVATSASSRCDATAGWAEDYSDCDDLRGTVNPAATETCETTYDDDCDGVTNVVDADACASWYVDYDGDGWGGDVSRCQCSAADGYGVNQGGDCDDADAGMSPGEAERCDGIDQDCDGTVDDGLTLYYVDADRDGWGDAAILGACTWFADAVSAGGDCDDADDRISPEAEEECDALDVDEDCDGLADDADGDAAGMTEWYVDSDGDGYGNASVASVEACDPTGSRTAVPGDCDDSDAEVSPGATERYGDDVDDDCDGALEPIRSYCSPIQVPDTYSSIDSAVDTYGLTEVCLGKGEFEWSSPSSSDGNVIIRGQGMGVTTITTRYGRDVYSSAEDLTIDAEASAYYADLTYTRVEITSILAIHDDTGESRTVELRDCMIGDRIQATAGDQDVTVYAYNAVVGLGSSVLSDALALYSQFTGDKVKFYCYGCTLVGSYNLDESSSSSHARVDAYLYNTVYTSEDSSPLYSTTTLTTYNSVDGLDDLDMSYDPPRPTGSLLDAGGSYGSTTDFWGVTRGSPPDIGAVEVP